MVTGKKVLIHLIILTLIVVAIISVEHFQKEQIEKAKGVLFEEFQANEIHSMEFTHKDSLIVLKKVKGVWLVHNNETKASGGYIADTLMVQKIFDKMPLLNKKILTASSKKAEKDLEVNKEDGIHVTMYDASNKLVTEFFIGKKAKVWSNSYLRKKGEKKIYSVAENIRFAFKCDLLEWRQRKMIDVKKEDITFIHFNSVETGVMNIGQSPEKSWHLIGDSVDVLDDTLMAPIFKEILSIRAANWVYQAVPDTEMGFINPSLTLGFELKDGKKIAFIVGNKEADRPRYYVKSSESNEVFFMLNAKVRFMLESFVNAKKAVVATKVKAEETSSDSTTVTDTTE